MPWPFRFRLEAFSPPAFLAAESCGLTVGSLGHFSKSGVLLTTGCGAVWQPSFLTLLTLWARANFTSLPTAFPSWYSIDSAQPSVYSVSWRRDYNSLNTFVISSLTDRNLLFSPEKSINFLDHFLNTGHEFHLHLKRPVQAVFLQPPVRPLTLIGLHRYCQLSSELPGAMQPSER